MPTNVLYKLLTSQQTHENKPATVDVMLLGMSLRLGTHVRLLTLINTWRPWLGQITVYARTKVNKFHKIA